MAQIPSNRDKLLSLSLTVSEYHHKNADFQRKSSNRSPHGYNQICDSLEWLRDEKKAIMSGGDWIDRKISFMAKISAETRTVDVPGGQAPQQPNPPSIGY